MTPSVDARAQFVCDGRAGHMGKRSAVVELFLGDMGSMQRELRPSTQREDQLTMETKLEQIAVKAVNQLELSLNFGDGRGRLGGGGFGLTVSRLGDDLDPVVECHTENEFWQLVVAVETAPAFLRSLEQFEDHRERGPVRQTALRSDRTVAHSGEGVFVGLGEILKCLFPTI